MAQAVIRHPFFFSLNCRWHLSEVIRARGVPRVGAVTPVPGQYKTVRSESFGARRIRGEDSAGFVSPVRKIWGQVTMFSSTSHAHYAGDEEQDEQHHADHQRPHHCLVRLCRVWWNAVRLCRVWWNAKLEDRKKADKRKWTWKYNQQSKSTYAEMLICQELTTLICEFTAKGKKGCDRP